MSLDREHFFKIFFRKGFLYNMSGRNVSGLFLLIFLYTSVKLILNCIKEIFPCLFLSINSQCIIISVDYNCKQLFISLQPVTRKHLAKINNIQNFFKDYIFNIYIYGCLSQVKIFNCTLCATLFFCSNWLYTEGYRYHKF